MEFGIFLNGFIPGPLAHDTDWEHEHLMTEVEYAVHADAHNWKYAWFGEHHGLAEYSHMSAPEVVMGMVAARTSYIHLSSGINSLSPRKEHPVRYAERAAMLDHITGRRYEWGTGRGAGSHEMASFNIMDTNSTKAEWDEVVREIPRMWEQVDYTHEGSFTVPTPHNILPKPWGPGHPPIWVACGNPATFAKAGQAGIGAIAFNFEPIYNLRGRIESYKEGIANCTEPIGQFMNDNVMMTNAVLCFEDRAKARRLAMERMPSYVVSMVNLYHDTMPKSTDGITWPDTPRSMRDTAKSLGMSDDEFLDQAIAGGYLLCGNAEEVCEQVEAYKSVGCDQLVFGMPQDLHPDENMEMLEVFGDHVIPEHDHDRVHSTDRYRATAKPKYGPFSRPLPDIAWPTKLPVTAQR